MAGCFACVRAPLAGTMSYDYTKLEAYVTEALTTIK